MSIKNSKSTKFTCQNCNFISPKWLGKCPNCEKWNSFVELKAKIDNNLKNFKFQTIEDINKNNLSTIKYSFGNKILDDFWNEGLTKGSLILLSGEPGLGKSTLCLQLLRGLKITQSDLKCVYFVAEESTIEVAKRSKRLNINVDIWLDSENKFEKILDKIELFKPEIVIIDSIQTISSELISGSPGSVSQVTYIANQLLAISKQKEITMILVGHVTKEGQIAGPKTLIHIVDSVLNLESTQTDLRTITFSKHRYGSTNNQVLLKMQPTGLEIITNPGLALLGNLENGNGICYGIIIEKNLPLIVEIQALVTDSNQSFGRREVSGISLTKLNLILAIMSKYMHINILKNDVYLQLLGNVGKVDDHNLDLAILLAIYSSYKNKSIDEILNFTNENKNTKNPKPNVFAGRLTLSGNLRMPNDNKLRQKIAQNLGMKYNENINFGKLVNLF